MWNLEFRSVPAEVVLIVTVALLTLYVAGVGGATAAAIGARESWRRRRTKAGAVDLSAPSVTLDAPALPAVMSVARWIGWCAFPFALALGIFENGSYPWVAPVTVLLMVAINAFYFTAMPALGAPLVLTPDGFSSGGRPVRWVYVTDLSAGRLGTLQAPRAFSPGEWRDRRERPPNVIFYRLNRALVHRRRPFLGWWIGLGYYDGLIRNAFGVETDRLLKEMLDRRRRALDAEGPPLRRPPSEASGRRRRGE